MRTGEHFRRYAHAIRSKVDLRGTQKSYTIVKYEHYQMSSGARASLYSYSHAEIIIHRPSCILLYKILLNNRRAKLG